MLIFVTSRDWPDIDLFAVVGGRGVKMQDWLMQLIVKK